MPSFELIRSLFFTITYQESECANTKTVLPNRKHTKQGQQPPDPSFKLVHKYTMPQTNTLSYPSLDG